MEIPQDVAQGLKNIRWGLHLRWNPQGKLVKPGMIDAAGGSHSARPVYEPRFELWDTDTEGRDYKIMSLQFPDGSFRQPGEWIVELIKKMNPERYGGSVEKLLQAMIDEPEVLREAGTQKDSDNMIDWVARDAGWAATPKSAAALSYRGERALSGGARPLVLRRS